MTDAVSADELRHLLLYDASTGGLTWLPRGPESFDKSGSRRSLELRASMWNAKNAGRAAFTSASRKHSKGLPYRTGAIYGRTYSAHRVAWALYYGEWPSQCIDHVNGDTFDNRITNLRSVCHAENMRNQKTRKNNKSGACGVSWNNGGANGFWVATIGGRHIGSFALFEDAVAARMNAQAAEGYHLNHGRRT